MRNYYVNSFDIVISFFVEFRRKKNIQLSVVNFNRIELLANIHCVSIRVCGKN